MKTPQIPALPFMAPLGIKASDPDWMVVELKNGKIEAWRDYGWAWGSPAYTILGYMTSTTHRAALRAAKAWKDQGSPESDIFSR